MPRALILFGSTLGDTERIAGRLAELLPSEATQSQLSEERLARWVKEL